MPTRAGPIICVVTVCTCTTVSCHNSSSSAGSNPRRHGLSAYKDCHIWFTCLRSFWSHVLECTTAIPKVTVTVLQFAEDNPHGAAVVTLLQDLRMDKYCTLTLTITLTFDYYRVRLKNTQPLKMRFLSNVCRLLRQTLRSFIRFCPPLQ